MGAYRDALAGLVALPDLMECSLADFGKRLAMFLREEQQKPLPDNALIAVLCDAARVGDELSSSGAAGSWAARGYVMAQAQAGEDGRIQAADGWRCEACGSLVLHGLMIRLDGTDVFELTLAGRAWEPG